MLTQPKNSGTQRFRGRVHIDYYAFRERGYRSAAGRSGEPVAAMQDRYPCGRGTKVDSDVRMPELVKCLKRHCSKLLYRFDDKFALQSLQNNRLIGGCAAV
jgi:hypothetical protein